MAHADAVEPAAGMRFGVLGPLQVVDGSGTGWVVSAAKQRIVLATLLLAGGRTVSAASLAESLWDGFPPPNAAMVLRTYLSRLRHTLGPAGARIAGRPPGWAVELHAPEEFDLAEAESLRQAARTAAEAQDWGQASVLLSRALGLWRGEPLVDVPSAALTRREAGRLAELRLQLTEARIDADLCLGRHNGLVAELWRLAAEHPLREHVRAQLMLACYRCGQQAAALEVYRDARATLAGELGVEPGNELREMHQRVLTADPLLTAAAGAAIGRPEDDQRPCSGREVVVPRQLPAAVSCFTGRGAELAALTGLLDRQQGGRAPAVVISAIAGTAGIGKTALAVQWAHQVAARFPGGQLYVNLRGYDRDDPVPAADALAGFLHGLGVPGPQVPDGVEDRARLYRTMLAGRQVLVLLDNARDGEQVRPLLPGDAGSVAVVTSRDHLAGLVAADGAVRLALDVLPPADAVALLASLIGSRADADPGAVAELAVLCARLPLALRIAAELAAARPAVPLSDLVAELEAARLDGLDAGEDRADVRAVFSWSLRQLDESTAAAFALTGLHPGENLDMYAAAALAGTSTAQARRVLRRLHQASLVQDTRAGRYGLHDLLRVYARTLAAARDAGGQTRQALTRLFDYYLAAAAAAMNVLYPAEAHHRPRVPRSAVVMPEMRGEAGARAWLDAERSNLVAVVAHCAGHGWPSHATGLAGTVFRYLYNGHLPEASTVCADALRAARAAGDLAGEAAALNAIGGIDISKGNFRDAADHFQGALQNYRRCGDRTGEARALNNLGLTEQELHNLSSAAGYYHQAIAAYQDAGHGAAAARTVTHLAAAEIELGLHDNAAEHLQSAVPVLRNAKDHYSEAGALLQMGDLSLCRGELAQAVGYFEQAMAIFRRIDHPDDVAEGLSGLGRVSLRQCDYLRAISYLRQAIDVYRRASAQHGEIRALRRLAVALDGAGQPAAARAELQTALRLAAESGDTYQQASAHSDLADSHHCAGQDDQARYHWEHALSLYTQLGAPEAEQIRPRLNADHGPQVESPPAQGTG
jgi:DNA-binding SARP family transcriptional activator/tetratricopeptide (TPR) repeat protein